MLLPLPLLLALSQAPAQLPRVTARWEDPTQTDVLVVEGARYRCRVATLPAHVLSLSVDGKELLGPSGLSVSVLDAAGRRLAPAPATITPQWDVWRGQHWQPATSARARMNVWSATPYYWDAHVLDIPLMAAEDVAATAGGGDAPALVAYDFAKDAAGWRPSHATTFGRAPDGALRIGLTGGDPFIEGPPCNVAGPVRVTLRLRTAHGGGGAVYWQAEGDAGQLGSKVVTFGVSDDNAWHDYTVALPETKRITALRFDPPGEDGSVDLAWLKLSRPPSAADRHVPSRGELVFHAQPDRLAIELRVDPAPGAPAPKTAVWEFDGAPSPARGMLGDRPMALLGDTLGMLGTGDCVLKGRTWTAPLGGPRPGTWLVLRPGGLETMAEEQHPLTEADVAAEGGHWLGYDPINGLYQARLTPNAAAFGFDAAFHNPARRMSLGLTVKNGPAPRTILVKAATGAGNLEAAVLADRFGFMLPTAAFVAKNFAGEMEEPDDAAFGDAYFPLTLAANETKELQVLPLTHGWGQWPLKQVSSIRFFLIYWHCSTGASETTCWSHNWMTTKNAIFEIPDFRPLSGPFWPGQPQHDCQHWPGWLQYNDARGRLCYERTDFDSVSPSLARFTMRYHTADNTATASVEAMEAPQRDEMRTFVHLRYDWTKPCQIEGDARRNLRLLNMSYFRGRNEVMLWTGADGQTVVRPVPPKDDLVMLGEPLAKDAPFMASSGPGDKYGVITLVRRFEAKLGGKAYDRPALSMAFDNKDASTWLTVPATTLQLQPGDYVDMDVELMPHSEPAPPALKPERERTRYGLKPVKLAMHTGELLSEWPPHVRAVDDVAAFHLEGGHGDLPLLVDGLSGWKVPLLWTNGVWQDAQVHGGDGYQAQPDGNGGYRATLLAPHRDGQSYDFVVTRASCTGDIARLEDRNGRLVLHAAQPGHWQLHAPAMFGPGTTRYVPKAAAFAFEGDGAEVAQLPLQVEAGKPVAVTVVRWTEAARELRVDGPCSLALDGLRPGGSYRVTVGGRTTTRTTADGGLKVDLVEPGPLLVER